MKKSKKSKSFFKKFKRQNKLLKTLLIIIGLFYLIGNSYFIYSLLLLDGIETLIRMIFIALIIIYFFFYIIYGLVLLFTKKHKKLICLLIITTLFLPLSVVLSFYINKTFGIINTVQKKYVNYTSVMISKKDINEYKKIGIISSPSDPVGHIIPKEIIKENKLKAEIVEYNDYLGMVSDLYDDNIDAFFSTENYVSMFNNYDKYKNIENETKIVYKKQKRMENIDNISYSSSNLTEPFTVLLMGIDGTGDGIDSNTSFNGDSLMLITFNPKTLSSTIFSIPRDTFVPISCRNNKEAKINTAAYGGTKCVVDTIENLTDIKIDYYAKVNFTGVVKIVDDIGGIELDVPIKFCEQDSKRRFGEYLICLDKGYQKLNGEQALAFARHRHSLPLGDFQRVQHQQMVVEAMAKKLKDIRSVDDFYKILNDVSNNIDTNMSTNQILSLYNVGKNILLNKLDGNKTLSIQKTYLTGYDLTPYLKNSKSYAYTFQYYKQSLDEITKAMKINLGKIKPVMDKTFTFNVNEDYVTETIGKKYYQEKKRELLPNFIGKNKREIDEWNKDKNIIIKYNEITLGDSLYDETKENDTVVYQSEHHNQIVDTLKEIEFSIIKKSEDKKEIIIEQKEEKEEIEKLPDFKNKPITYFQKWRNELKNSNIIFEEKELSVDDLLTMDTDTLEDGTIYKQSIDAGVDLKEITKLTVYYYKKIN